MKTINGIIIICVFSLVAACIDAFLVDAAWYNVTMPYKANLTQINGYPDAFLAGSRLLTINGSGIEIWCEKNTGWLYFKNETGKDIYCVNSTETGNTGTNLVNTTFPDTLNPWDKDALIILHLNGTDGYDSSIYKTAKVVTTGTPDAVSGIIGGGVNFGANERLNYGDLNAMDGLTTLTAMSWVNYTNTGNMHQVIGKYSGGTSGWALIYDGVNGAGYGKGFIFVLHTEGTLRYCNYTTATGTASLNTWYHYAATYDGDNAYVYIDGQLKATCTTPTGLIAANTVNFTVGESADGSQDFYGVIDEVRVYNRTMNATEINETYWSQKIGFNFSYLGSVINYTAGAENGTEPAVPANITLGNEIKFCYNDNYLYKKTKDIAENGSAVFNEYLVYCDYGCSNSTLMELGKPGCKASDTEQFIILIVICAVVIIGLRWVLK
jgi:hypothetical protein